MNRKFLDRLLAIWSSLPVAVADAARVLDVAALTNRRA